MNTIKQYSESLHFLDGLGFTFLGNQPSSWLLSILISLLLFIILTVVKKFVLVKLARLASRTTTHLDDMLVAILARTTKFFLLTCAILVGSWALTLGTVASVVHKIAIIVVFWQIGIWAATLLNEALKYWLEKNSTDGSKNTAIVAFRFVGSFLIWALISLLILDNLGVKVVSLMAGLGVGGIAIALAVQSILGDLLSSISIVLDKPFELGDFIIVGDSLGTVEHVRLKTTRLRSLSGEQLIISNSDLLSSRIRNYKRMSERRMVHSVNVTYQTSQENLAAIPSILRKIIESQSRTRFDRAHLTVFGSYAITFEYVYWMTVPGMNDSLDTQQAISLAMFKAFAEAKIEYAYPTQKLYVENEADAKSITTKDGLIS